MVVISYPPWGQWCIHFQRKLFATCFPLSYNSSNNSSFWHETQNSIADYQIDLSLYQPSEVREKQQGRALGRKLQVPQLPTTLLTFFLNQESSHLRAALLNFWECDTGRKNSVKSGDLQRQKNQGSEGHYQQLSKMLTTVLLNLGEKKCKKQKAKL